MVGAEWYDRTGQGAAPLQETHWFDCGRGGPSNIVSSMKYDEDSSTTSASRDMGFYMLCKVR